MLLSLPGVPWVIIQTRKNGEKKEKKRKGYHGWTNLENSSIDFMMMINYGVKMIVIIMMMIYYD